MNASTLADLLDRIARKDEEALEELRGQTALMLAAYIRRIVRDAWNVDEVLQDVYLYVWLHAAGYRRERGTPLNWLHMLARSRALDSYRRNRTGSRVSSLEEQVRPLPCVEGPPAPEEVWRHAQVRRGVRELPADQSRLIGLAFVEGYTHSEIARSTGLPLGTVKTRIRAALNRLEERLTPALAA